MKEENINALDEIHKGACMGRDAIHFTLDKVEDNKLKEVLEKQYADYQSIATRIEEIYPQYNDGKPHETNAMTKTMTWSGIEMKTMTDKSNSKIAELVLQGTNKRIKEVRKILKNKNIDKKVYKLISEFVTMQEDSVEKLKTFL